MKEEHPFYQRRRGGPKPRYSDEFIRLVVYEILTEGLTFQEAIDKHGIVGTPAMLQGWMNRWEEVLNPKVPLEEQEQAAALFEAEQALKSLKGARQRLMALDTLIDEASKELGVDIRKILVPK